MEGFGKIASEAYEGAKPAIKAAGEYDIKKMGLKEKKRRNIANLMNSAMKRGHNLFKFEQENAGENQENKATALQNAAKSFAQAIHSIKR